jgi:signal peptidase I
MRIRASVAVLVVALCGCKTYYGPYRVVSDSMSPTVRTGDRIMVDESAEARTNLHDGDVIMIRHGDAVVLKRILAMPGETIRGEDRKVFRDGKLVAEPYLAAPSDFAGLPNTFAERKVVAGELFVLGDNRDHSLDSRAEDYGAKVEDVVGKYGWTYWQAAAEATPQKK